jgi:uncharacterized membrane protein
MARDPSSGRPPPRTSGLLFGLGLGGFVDGIVLHQILQWHHMVSAGTPPTTLAGLEVNTVADGFFHLATWVCVLAASVTTISAWRQGRLAPSYSFHFGLVLVGWGIFHHVRDDLGAPLSWDLGFLASGVLLVVGGWLIHRRGARSLERRAAAVR